MKLSILGRKRGIFIDNFGPKKSNRLIDQLYVNKLDKRDEMG